MNRQSLTLEEEGWTNSVKQGITKMN